MSRRLQFSLRALLVVTAIVSVHCAALVLILPHLRPGIKVVVRNTGETALCAVVLHVTGNAHPLGDLAPSASKEATVEPTSESDLEIEFVDDGGHKLRLGVDVYIEPGYRGTIWVSIKDGAIDKNEHQVNVY